MNSTHTTLTNAKSSRSAGRFSFQKQTVLSYSMALFALCGFASNTLIISPPRHQSHHVIPWTKQTGNFLLSPVLFGRFSLICFGCLVDCGYTFFVFFFLPPPTTARAETTREIYGPCVSFVEIFLMFLRWHHAADPAQNKRGSTSSGISAVGRRRATSIVQQQSSFRLWLSKRNSCALNQERRMDIDIWNRFPTFRPTRLLFFQRDNRPDRSYSPTFTGRCLPLC
jgi:hypothetical protein